LKFHDVEMFRGDQTRMADQCDNGLDATAFESEVKEPASKPSIQFEERTLLMFSLLIVQEFPQFTALQMRVRSYFVADLRRPEAAETERCSP
jgi:hypothetical protein